MVKNRRSDNKGGKKKTSRKMLAILMGVYTFLAVVIIIMSAVYSRMENELEERKFCRSHLPSECPADCTICPPCEGCSSLTCQTEEFCSSIGFKEK